MNKMGSEHVPKISLFQALNDPDPTALMPLDFLKLFWIATIGVRLFAEVPDIFTWIGATVISASGLFIAFRGRQTKQRNKFDAE